MDLISLVIPTNLDLSNYNKTPTLQISSTPTLSHSQANSFKEMVDMEDDKGSLIPQDILEPILSYVPLIDLAPALYVSESWNRAIRSSLRYLNKPKPWLLVHRQNIWSTRSSVTHAYDPRSCLWIQIKSPLSIAHGYAIRSSSDSKLLYIVKPKTFSFSMDPLRMMWHHVAAPATWRDDPVVVMMGRKIVVAGGVCDFEDDDMAVETYDLDSGTWDTNQSMPESLCGSCKSWLLSVASDDKQLYLTDKSSGDLHVFHPEKNTWSGPHSLYPHPSMSTFFSVISYMAGQLILISLECGKDQKIKLSKVDTSSFVCEPIGEMPSSLVKKLGTTSTIEACASGNLVYIYNPSEVAEMVTCELVKGGGLRWESVSNIVQGKNSMNERVIYTCTVVGLEDVTKAMKENKSRCTIKRI